ncbi:MAG: biotin--[acetyl-CoA-carboxylase] ligase [Clostridia bacterium]|nr:biotin--[acetyl-CoA-carboxylase] ligase [Clostridia bacterium]
MIPDWEASICQELGPEWRHAGVRALRQTDSTNLRLKEAARAGEISAPYVLAADCQTAGRGRLGRSFLSPPGTGLYMSILFAPPLDADSGSITILAAVAVCRAIEEMTDLKPKIKWVNDLFVNGKKVCGILAERIGEGVIVGIGVNVKMPVGGFPPEAGAAGALEREMDRGKLAGRIARHFLDGTKNLSDPAILNAYRARMALMGREIRYTQNGQEKNALVLGVADDGGLMVETEEGPRTLRTGEVTLGSEGLAGRI